MSNRNFRNQPTQSNDSHNVGQTMYGGMPQLPPMPLGGGFTGSPAGSEYGGHMSMAALPYQNTGSMYGMPSMAGVPQGAMVTGMNMFGGPTVGGFSPAQSAVGTLPPSAGVNQRPLSTFSLATTVNPFAGPSQNPDPSDEELFQALRNYLSTQDLMTVTKK
jgi:chitin synthase